MVISEKQIKGNFDEIIKEKNRWLLNRLEKES